MKLAFHNLCSSNALPTGSRELLSLNLKFCIASRSLPYNLNKTMIKNNYTLKRGTGIPHQLLISLKII